MAKIYAWTAYGQSGEVVANNTKEVKVLLATRFNNKRPRAVIEKKGLAKGKVKEVKLSEKAQRVMTEFATPVKVPNHLTEEEMGEVLKKDIVVSNASFRVDGLMHYMSKDAEMVVHKGQRYKLVVDWKKWDREHKD